MNQPSFSALTYNVLAQAYVKPSRYRDVAPAALEATARRALLLRRITAIDADILCLQEVEPAVFEAVGTALPNHGGVFEQKRGRPEGSATFFRRERFTLEHSASLHYAACEPGYDHLALVTSLRDQSRPSSTLAVANTHLRWQSERTAASSHLGALQLTELLTYLGGRYADQTWLIAGDLNAISQSPVLEHAQRAGLVLSARSLRPWDTALINGRRRKLDYLLHRPGTLEPTPRSLPGLSPDTPIPSLREPSDHLPLQVDFSWC